MFPVETSPFFAACRRGLSALLCAILLFAAVVPPSAASQAAYLPSELCAVTAQAGDTESGPDRPDQAPCHTAHHSCGNPAALLPIDMADGPRVTQRLATLTPAPAHALLSGISELPTEPPRA